MTYIEYALIGLGIGCIVIGLSELVQGAIWLSPIILPLETGSTTNVE